MSDNVIAFPKNNKRLDVSDMPVSAEEVAREITKIRLDFYYQVADEMMETLMRTIGALGISKAEVPEEVNVEDIDVIFMREMLAAFMCRIANVEHPLVDLPHHFIGDLDVNEIGAYTYKVNTIEDLKKSK